MYICKFCNREGKTKKSNWIHQSRCKENPKRFKQIPWNKGLINVQVAWNKGLSGVQNNCGRASTIEQEQERIRKIKENSKNNGGYRKGSGRGKKGRYKGFYCDSSYELAFVVYNLDHNIPIERCKEIRTYKLDSKIKNYHPDFIVDGKIIEIKGFNSKQWEAKILYNQDIIVLFKKDLKDVFLYVEKTYGKNFINLYE